MFLKHTIALLIGFLSIHVLQAADGELTFLENKGQWEENIRFNARLNFGNLYLEKDKLTFRLIDYPSSHQHDNGSNHEHESKGQTGHQYSLQFLNCNSNIHYTYSGKSPHAFNFFLGNNPKRWQTDVKSYSTVSYRNLYDGIQLSIFGLGENIKYEYYVSPNGDTRDIQVKYLGLNNIEIIDQELHYHTAWGDVKELAPYAYQSIDGEKIEVPCHYDLDKKSNVLRYEFPNGYNKNYELVIDPTIVFARLSGSTSDNFGFTATYDANGRAYSGGIVFGITGQYQTSPGAFSEIFFGGSANSAGSGQVDIGISCYNAGTGNLAYGTYIGGSSNELPNSMIVNNKGELIVLGTTGSSDFPLGNNPYDASFNGGQLIDLQSNGIYLPNGSDMVLFKLNATGTMLTGGTYIGGSANDGLNDDLNIQLSYNGSDLHFNYGDVFRGEVIVDQDDNIYVASSTNSSDFPTLGVASNLQGEQDAVVLKLDSNLNTLLFSRFLGGSDDDAGYSMKIDANNHLFVDGGTKSSDFPTLGNPLNPNYLGGECDGFISKLNASDGSLITSSFIGTSSYDQVYFVDLDEDGNVYLLGQTLGSYPIVSAGFSNAGGKQFIHKMDNDLSTTIYSTTFGTGATSVDISPTALLVDNCERVFVSGWGGTTNLNRNSFSSSNIAGLPLTPDAFQSNTVGGGDFYFFVLDKNATGQLYGSYFGGSASEHVDGGTSRFDERGIVYQSICAACGNGNFPASGGFSQNSASSNCNEGIVKIDIGLPITQVELDAFPRATGCAPLTVNFSSVLEDVVEFQWFFGDGDTSNLPNPTHTYQDTGVFTVMLIGIDPNSCNERDSAFLTVTVSDDTLIARSIDTLYANCDSLGVYVGSEFVPSTQYDWFMGDGTVYTDAGHFQSHNYPSSGEYEIVLHITDTTKCETEAWDTVRVSFAPEIPASIGTEVGCVNTLLNFENFSNPNADLFIWDLGNGQISNEFEPSMSYASGGNYTVILMVIDSATCSYISSDTAIVNIIAPPNANFTSDSSYYLYPDRVQFTNLSFNFDNFLWTFGDGEQDSAILDPLHFYETPGNFRPCLKVSNQGCEDSTCLDLFIDFIPLIGVPNAFSPNGDNVNDRIFVEGDGIVSFNFLIYNRWGELVYESNDPNEGWDGTYKGVPQEMEVYTYVVSVQFIDASTQSLKGNITLLR